MLPLAEVSPSDLGIFLACLGVVVALLLGLKKLTHRDPPLYREFASKEEHDAFVHRSELAIAEIYNLIREQGQQLARWSQKTDTTHAALNNLEMKIDRILERLPRP